MNSKDHQSSQPFSTIRHQSHAGKVEVRRRSHLAGRFEELPAMEIILQPNAEF